MADIGTLLSVAQTLFAALECSELKKIKSLFGYESELEDLKETVSTIRKVLLDLDAKQELSNEWQDWIEKLKDAVYDADDIFDEFVALVKRRETDILSEKVRGFFSLSNPLIIAYKMSQGVKKIRKKLDKIASNHSKYGTNVGYVPVRRKIQETDSRVNVADVIGREDDAKAVIDMLFSSDTQDVSVVTIVGIGGLGKTTLAKLVYNDENVRKTFSLIMWVCVSDQDEKYFDMKSIVAKILESATGDKHEGFSLDSLQKRLGEILKANQYFLVLDDVWNEDHLEWEKLRSVLRLGGRGSKIVLTTRSKKTAEVVRGGRTYELKGLSETESWRLFEITAFGDEEEDGISPTLLDIGKKIVKTCANVPLAIKVVGSLLFGEKENTWLSFQDRDLSDIRKDKNEMLHILKLSYHYLEPPLKGCFAYCALFPKDFVIKKDVIISLWIAQGYVVPLDKGQSIDDAAEEYFSILLRKCFFQDTEVNGYGEIVSCKIHDLMHDVALEVAGNEICLGYNITSGTDHKIRHVFLVRGEGKAGSFTKTKVRSYLRDGWSCSLPVVTLVSNCKYLRSLDLHNLDIKSLPDSIGNLLHLRYFDLSWNHDLKTLPKSIARLHNLQTLCLKDCFSLQELPQGLSNLINLRHLDTIGCKGLTYMPSSMDKLSCLCVLTSFTVAEANSDEKLCVGQLEDLKGLTKLKGHLSLWIKRNQKYTTKLHSEDGYLKKMGRLKSLRISWKGEENDRRVADEEALLEDLEPHPNLRELILISYCGLAVPRWWAREDNLGTFLPNLVKIELENCHGLPSIPSMGNLHSLKSLTLRSLMNLVYIENRDSSSTYAAASTSGSLKFRFFSSLEELVLWDLPQLTGWWRTVVSDRFSTQPAFPLLSKLVLGRCPNLTSLPPCPTVATLCLYWFSKSLPTIMGKDHMALLSSRISQSLDIKSPYKRGHLSRIDITGAKNLKSLSEMAELLQTGSSSLRSLTIENCYELESISGGLENLNALESLIIHDVPNLKFGKEKDQAKEWMQLPQGLRSLDLCHLPQLVELPLGFRCLTALQTLKIQLCESLEALPGWIGSLTCLQSLHLISCNKLESLPEEMRRLTALRRFEVRHGSDILKERCRNPGGVDWPKIQSISSISVS